jgi:hypothetical protein
MQETAAGIHRQTLPFGGSEPRQGIKKQPSSTFEAQWHFLTMGINPKIK